MDSSSILSLSSPMVSTALEPGAILDGHAGGGQSVAPGEEGVIVGAQFHAAPPSPSLTEEPSGSVLSAMASKSSGVCNSSLATTLALIGAFLETAAPPMSPMMIRSLWEATALTMSVGVSRRASSFSGSGQMRMDISAPNSSTRPTPSRASIPE